jgi:hypothetical protein
VNNPSEDDSIRLLLESKLYSLKDPDLLSELGLVKPSMVNAIDLSVFGKLPLTMILNKDPFCIMQFMF